MARGVALSELVKRLRLETSGSSSAIANADEKEQLEHLLRAKQEFYYDDYDWPHLNVFRRITPVQNQRFYAFPSDMNFEAVEGLYVKDGTDYVPLRRGVGFQQYNSEDSLKAVAAVGSFNLATGASGSVDSVTVDSVELLSAAVSFATSLSVTAIAVAANITANTSTPNYTATAAGTVVTITAAMTAGTSANTFVVAVGVTTITADTLVNMTGGVDAEQSDPAANWELREDDETDAEAIEVWPVPASSASQLWLVGKRSLPDLLADADVALLDDQLLVLTAAAEILAKRKKADAQVKAIAAGRRYLQMKARSRAAVQPFKLRGDDQEPMAGTIVRVSG